MAIDKAVDSAKLDGALKASADEIRAKTGDVGKVLFDLDNGTGFKAAIAAIQAGSGGGDAEDYGKKLAFNELEEIPIAWQDWNSVPNNAFQNKSNLREAIFTSAVSVGNDAFSGCTKLATVNISAAARIEQSGFNGCSALVSIYAPNVTYIGTYGFNGCKSLTDADFSKVETIGAAAFQGCNAISEFYFPALIETVTDGWCNAFQNVSATRFSAPLLERIGSSTFNGSAITDFDIPNVKRLSGSGFGNTKAVIADFRHLEEMAARAFEGNKSMIVVNLPIVSKMNGNTFQNSNTLEYVMLGALESMQSNEFTSCTNCKLVLHNKDTVATCANPNSIAPLAAIYVPKSLLADYKAATNYSAYADKIFAIEDSADVLAKLAEYGNEYEVSE